MTIFIHLFFWSDCFSVNTHDTRRLHALLHLVQCASWINTETQKTCKTVSVCVCFTGGEGFVIALYSTTQLVPKKSTHSSPMFTSDEEEEEKQQQINYKNPPIHPTTEGAEQNKDETHCTG